MSEQEEVLILEAGYLEAAAVQSEGRRRAGAASSPALRYSVHEEVLPSRTVVQYREVGLEWKGSGGQHRGKFLGLERL